MKPIQTEITFWLDLGDLGSVNATVSGEVIGSISGGRSGFIKSIRVPIPLASGHDFVADVIVNKSTRESIEHELALSVCVPQDAVEWEPNDVA